VKRALLLSFADLATTYLVAALGFWTLGAERMLWIVVGAVSVGTTARLALGAALERASARRAFVLETLRQRGELGEVGHVVPIDADDNKNWIGTGGAVPTYAPHKSYGFHAATKVEVCRPSFNEPNGSQRLVGLAGVPMSHEEAARVLGEFLDAVAPPRKPASVEPGQRWTCVGIDGALVVCSVIDRFLRWPRDIGLRPDGSDGPATVRAREVDMLGLAEWRFVG
jgi:hypothetical protein